MANMEIGELQVAITAQAGKFSSEIKKVQNQLKNFEAKATSGFGGISTKAVAAGNILAKAFTTAMATVSASMDDAFSRLDTLNNFPTVMSNLGIGASDAQKSINTLSEKLIGLPTTLDDAALAVQRFTSANNNVQASTEMFLALNNAILAGGASAEVQATAVEQLSQAYAKGKADSQEWRAMMTAMPAQLKQVANSLGYTSIAVQGDLYNAMQDGKVTMNDFMTTFVKLNKEGYNGFKSFEQQARNATGGVATSITNMKTAFVRGLTTIMEQIGQSNIAGFFNGISNAISTVANYVAAFVRIIKEAIAWVGALFGWEIGSTDGLVKETSSASSNLEGIASGASDAASGLDDATGSAKKLRKQLAAFDEMNVLQDQDSSGSGSSGSSGGSMGALDPSAFTWDTSAFKTSGDKIAQIVDKIKKKFKELFGTFDFDKIGKAFKKFVDDVKTFLEPLGRILSDVWNDYLSPFINWAGNDLLPAFLNALGGAIAVVGKVIGQFWDTFLKPFIDAFLVPIAQWTGGIIVSVLNAIGDALHWVAEQQYVIDVITNIASAIAVCAATVVGYNAVATILNGTLGTFGLINEGLPLLLENTRLGMAGITAGSTVFNSTIGAATTAASGFGTMLSGLAEAVFSPTTIVLLGVVAAYEAFRVVQEYCTLKTMEAELAEKEFITAEEKATEAANWHSDAIQRQKDLKEELRDATAEVTSAELDLINCQESTARALDNATTIAKKYGFTVEDAKEYVKTLDLASDSLTDRDRELAKAILELEDKQNRETSAVQKLTDAKQVVTDKTVETTNQAWKEIMALKEQQIQAKLSEGKYEEVSEALQELSDSSGEFQLANGEMVKFTKEDMESMADFIGDQLAKIDEDNGKAWKSVWEKAEYSSKKLKSLAKDEYSVGMEEAGANFQKGAAKGIEDNQWRVVAAATNSARAANKAFNNTLDIHSPSRVMAKAGRFFSQGVATGILGGIPSVTSAVANLANSAMLAFNNYELDTTLASSIANGIDVAKEVSGVVDIEESQTPVHVVVNVGEDTLVDKLINGANDLSFLQNRAVLTI